jgi:hypothetical protein
MIGEKHSNGKFRVPGNALGMCVSTFWKICASEHFESIIGDNTVLR